MEPWLIDTVACAIRRVVVTSGRVVTFRLTLYQTVSIVW
jgi:hypothetical protein